MTTPNSMSFVAQWWQGDEILIHFSPVSAQKVTCLGADGVPGSGLTLQHDSMIPNSGHERDQQQQMWCHDSTKQHEFCCSVRWQSAEILICFSPKSDMTWR
jgi:hypothetical protein